MELRMIGLGRMETNRVRRVGVGLLAGGLLVWGQKGQQFGES